MTVRSLIYAAEIIVGKLQLGHSDLSGCYDIPRGAMRYGQDRAQLDLKWNGNCEGATLMCSDSFQAVDLQFYEGEVLYHTESLIEFTQTSTAEGHLIEFLTDVDIFLQRILSRVNVQLTMQCDGGLGTKYLTAVAAFGSIEIRSLMINPVLVFYPNKMVITHAIVANS